MTTDPTGAAHDRLLERMQKILALHAGAATDGERDAAAAALHRVQGQLLAEEPATEFAFTINDSWTQQLFIALCERHGITPYRKPRQRRTTIMIKARGAWMTAVFEPEFYQLAEELATHLDVVASKVIAQVFSKPRP